MAGPFLDLNFIPAGVVLPLMLKPPPKYKMAVVIWLTIYPAITLVLYLLGPSLSHLPLPLRTLALTIIVVPLMVFVLLPRMMKLFNRWLYGT